MLRTLILIFCLLISATAQASDSDRRTLTIDGRDREYLVYRPANLERDAPVPLVIMMHGGFGTGSQAEKSYGWDKMADAKGFVVAYPDGMTRSWNAGGICCGKAAENKLDDVGFITALIETVSKDEKIDPKRVYLTGMSNGAAMAYRYGCEGSFPVAAIGVVSGSFSTPCAKAHAVSVMEIHGLADTLIPMAGGHGNPAHVPVSWVPVQQTVDTFMQSDNCPAAALDQKGSVHTATADCPDNLEVTLITIDDAGHQWPGSQIRSRIIRLMLPAADEPSTALNATETIWAFFHRHTAP